MCVRRRRHRDATSRTMLAGSRPEASRDITQRLSSRSAAIPDRETFRLCSRTVNYSTGVIDEFRAARPFGQAVAVGGDGSGSMPSSVHYRLPLRIPKASDTAAKRQYSRAGPASVSIASGRRRLGHRANPVISNDRRNHAPRREVSLYAFHQRTQLRRSDRRFAERLLRPKTLRECAGASTMSGSSRILHQVPSRTCRVETLPGSACCECRRVPLRECQPGAGKGSSRHRRGGIRNAHDRGCGSYACDCCLRRSPCSATTWRRTVCAAH